MIHVGRLHITEKQTNQALGNLSNDVKMNAEQAMAWFRSHLTVLHKISSIEAIQRESVKANPLFKVGIEPDLMVDVDGDGKADYAIAGTDNPISQLSESPARTPNMAAVAVDADGDGKADYVVRGEDLNRDGIPDANQNLMVDVDGDGNADYVIAGTDKDGDGIPDIIQNITTKA